MEIIFGDVSFEPSTAIVVADYAVVDSGDVDSIDVKVVLRWSLLVARSDRHSNS